MIVFIYFVLALVLIILVGLSAALNNFNNNVKSLFLQSNKIKNRVFHPTLISGLPAPVQDYFNYVLKDDQPYISYVRLRHYGYFKTAIDGKWATMKGEEYFTIEKPGFIWKGNMNGFTAIDKYIAGKGSLSVYLLRFIKILNGYGYKFSQGELLRWLGESVWFPTALLPSEHLYWEPMDDYHAKLVFRYKKLVVFYIVTFNDTHEIIQLETKRYMGGKELETWDGKLSNYRMLNNVIIPTTIEAIWKLKQQDFTYALFYLNEIEYNQSKRFKI